MSAHCRSCEARVRWVTTEAGRPMPVNPEPDPVRGNLVLDGDTVRVVANRAEALDAGTPLYLSHFVTCEFAGQHRKKG